MNYIDIDWRKRVFSEYSKTDITFKAFIPFTVSRL